MKMLGVLVVFSPILLIFGGFYIVTYGAGLLAVLGVLLLLDKAFPKRKSQQQLTLPPPVYLNTSRERLPK